MIFPRTLKAAQWVGLVGVAVLLSAGSPWAQQNIYNAQEQPKLIELLRSPDAPLYEKALACKKLAVIGTQEAVETLGGLLADPTLSHYARFALEPIPSPEVDRVLRQAAEKVSGRLLAGVIDSLGNRRDVQAIPLLEKFLQSDDEQIVEAAGYALGQIGTAAAAQRLEVTLQAPQPVRRLAAARGALRAAERAVAEGEPLRAASLYEAVWRAQVPAHVRMAGLRGVMLTRGEAGINLLLEQLQSEDKLAFQTALRVACELPASPALTEKLLGLMSQLPPARQAKLLSVLADRGDPASRPAVVQALEHQDAEVRLAAVRALRKLGDASVVPALLRAASGEDQELAQTAKDVLIALPGAEIDQAIVALLQTGSAKTRVVAIELAARRYIHAAVPALQKALDAPESEVRLAAIRALGYTTKLGDLPVLTERLLQSQDKAEREALEEALRAACPRIPEREECAAHLVQTWKKAPAELKPSLLRLLGIVGGKTALDALVAAVREGDEATRDVATQVLGEWMGTDAAAPLLELAKSDLPERFRIRAVRAYIRIIRQFDLTPAERVEMSRQALAVATRDAERRLVVEALARVVAPESLQLLLSLLDDTQLREDAAQAAVTVAEKLVATDRAQARAAAEQILGKTQNPETQNRAKAVLRRAQ
jgi:HEAT repeat protein